MLTQYQIPRDTHFFFRLSSITPIYSFPPAKKKKITSHCYKILLPTFFFFFSPFRNRTFTVGTHNARCVFFFLTTRVFFLRQFVLPFFPRLRLLLSKIQRALTLFGSTRVIAINNTFTIRNLYTLGDVTLFFFCHPPRGCFPGT